MGLTESYFQSRLLDTLLREDLFGVVSRAQLQPPPQHDGLWLCSEPLPGQRWFLPVRPHHQLQPWVSREPWLLVQEAGALQRVEDPRQLVERMLPLVDEGQALQEELHSALSHHRLVHRLRGTLAPVAEPWHASMARFDQIASLQDHPLYPLARAKVGLDESELQRYGPEWGQSFQLRWLGVERERVQVQGILPAWWPEPESLGLPAGYLPLPVHPHTAERLETPGGALWSSRPAVSVVPTLSVRSLAVQQHPAYHLKLPLFMRSLSYKNLRKVKPDTLYDGDAVQQLLAAIVARHAELRERVLLTDESTGLHVDERADLGCIVRRYPAAELDGCQVVPVAALAAPLPDGRSVLESLGPDFLDEYLELTLRFHLTLWCYYGIALESNQQNTLLLLHRQRPLRLLLKDNDAARIYRAHASRRLPVPEFRDRCLTVDSWEPIAQMFITITLQLNLQPFVSPQRLRQAMERALNEFPRELLDEARVRQLLLDPPCHPVKRLWSAGTLFSKARTGAADINKFYGFTAPNCLRAEVFSAPR